MSRFHVQVPLRWADLDIYRHVNHARAVTLLEEARVELVFHRAEEEGVAAWADGLLVASLRVAYRVQIPYQGQAVRVSMWTDQVRAASFVIHYEMHTGPAEHDPVAVTALTQMVPFDLVANRPRRLTAQERAFLANYADEPHAMQTSARARSGAAEVGGGGSLQGGATG
jgi:acyl-CoA thioester hydrolase